MANIREIQTRINSVKDTMKITNAMYMISSTKMRQAKKKLTDSEPYFYGLQGEISRILRHIPEIEHRYFDVREEIPKEKRKIGSIVITADKPPKKWNSSTALWTRVCWTDCITFWITNSAE